MISPLTGGNEIDDRALEAHLHRILPHIQALFIAGPNGGRGRSLGPDLRADLFERVLVLVRGKVPVLVWISGETEDRTVEILLMLRKKRETHNYRDPIFWVDTPLYYHSNRGLPSHYEQMYSLIKEPFVLHNDPELIKSIDRPFKRNNIRTHILKELTQMNYLAGLIFSGSLDRAYSYQEAVRSQPDFRIYDGDESRFLEYPSHSGVVSIGANLAPRAWQKITASSLHINGGDKDYPDHLKQIWDIGGYLNSLKDIYKGQGISLITRVLSDIGIMGDPIESQGKEIMKEERSALRSLLEQYGDYS